MPPILPLLRVHRRYWLRHRLQAALCIGGVALGVALFTAIRLANAGALDAFASAVEAFLGKATHRVFSPAGAGVPDAVYAQLAAQADVIAASPLLQDRLRIEGIAGDVNAIGIDPLSDAPFRATPFLGESASGSGDGSAPGSRRGSASPLAILLGTPGAVLVPEAMARRLGIVTDGSHLATIHATVQGQPRTLTVAGMFTPPPDQAELLGATVLMDIATHQELFGKRGRLEAVRLILPPGADARVRALLPASLELEPVGRRLERVERMSAAFRLNLEVLGLFSLLVGAFLILNAATFSVVQRQPLVAIQRCLGAGPGATLAALLAEAVVAGLAGGALGVPAGAWLAQRLVRGTSATLLEVILDAGPLPASATLTATTWLVGLAVGAGVAVCGSLLPALETYRSPPLAALRSSRRLESQPARLRRWAGAAAATAGIAALALIAPGRSLDASLAGATAAILCGALLCPLALWLAGRAASPVLGILLGATGRFAARQLSNSVARTGLAGASLTVALALALSVGITVASFRATFTTWLEQTITADLYLSLAADPAGAVFPPDLLRALKAQPFVGELAELRTRRIALGDRDVQVISVDALAFGRLNRVPVREGDRAEAVAALRDGAAWVSETLAYPLGLRAGAALRIPTASGFADLRVAAVVQNYSAPNGLIYLDHAAFRRLFGEIPVRQAAIWLRPDAVADAAVAMIAKLPGGADLRIVRNDELRAGAARVFERTFAITRLMTGLAAAVAFIAVVSASAALLDERRRLIGTLRAIGMSRRRLALAMAVESALLALVSCVLAWGVGVIVSAILVFVVNLRAFGWTLQFLPGAGEYVPLLGFAMAAALGGTLLPIARMWRTPILAAIREE
jgi:putative ABC transport system permease protein